MIIECSAPGRAGVIGNPTDMYGGSVISCSTRERARVTLRPADALTLETGSEQRVIRSDDDLRIQGDIFDIARAVLVGSESTGINVHLSWATDIPFRAGLSGSTALLTATLAGVLACRGIRHPIYYQAELARMIEYHHLGVFCGYQDAYMCAFGGLNYMDFRDKEFHQTFGSDPYATMEPLGPFLPDLPLTLIITGSQRISGTIHRPIRDRWVEGEPLVVDAYRNVGQLARAGKKALLHGRLDELGRLMNENHAISQSLGASRPDDDRFIDLARQHGALGAKLAGSGGAIIALNPQPDAMIEAALKAGATRIMTPSPNPGVTLEQSR
jgi:galactokinase/mevalonate kinase-like predicted kinase